MSRCPKFSPKNAQQKIMSFLKEIFFFIGPPLPLNELRVGIDMGKKDGCSKKN